MKALAHPTRLTMIASLWKAEAPICICDFTAGLELTQPTISHHMARLKGAGVVESEKRGIWDYYRLRQKLAPSTRQLLGQLIAQPLPLPRAFEPRLPDGGGPGHPSL